MDRWNLSLSLGLWLPGLCEQEDSSHFKNTIKCLWRPCYLIQTQMQNCLFSLTSDNVTLSCLSCTNTWIKLKKKRPPHCIESKTKHRFYIFCGGKYFTRRQKPGEGRCLTCLPSCNLLCPSRISTTGVFLSPYARIYARWQKGESKKKSPVLRTYGLPTKRQQWFLVTEVDPWPKPYSPDIFLCISGHLLCQSEEKTCSPCDCISPRIAANMEAPAAKH